jgi:hypothetical protein
MKIVRVLKPHQHRVLHASRMASRFAKTIAKQVEASLKKGTR